MHKKITANLIITLLLMGFICSHNSGKCFSFATSLSPNLFPVPNVSVSASGNGNGFAVTNAQGQYSITSYLDTGDYTLTTLAEGYVSTEVDNVPVTAGSTTANINIMITASGIITGQVTDALNRKPRGKCLCNSRKLNRPRLNGLHRFHRQQRKLSNRHQPPNRYLQYNRG